MRQQYQYIPEPGWRFLEQGQYLAKSDSICGSFGIIIKIRLINDLPMNPRHSLPSLLLALLLLAGLVGSVYAYATINAGDGAIDIAWQVTPLLSDGSDYAEGSADIDRAWFNADRAVPQEVAFRLETIGSIDTTDGTYYGIQIDCNDDDDFGDVEDLALGYDATAGDALLYSGDLNTGGMALEASEGQGEVVGAGNDTVEANYKKLFADNLDLGNHWTTCFNTPHFVRFVTTNSDTVLLDSTDAKLFDFLTPVAFRRLAGHAAAPEWGGLGLLGLGLAALLWTWRRR